mgnify:FL=1
MFFLNFKYSLKILLRNKALIFWTFAFPIVLATLYNMAFSNIEKKEALSVIDIAIVNSHDFDNNIMYKDVFNSLSNKDNEDRLFNIEYTNEESAKKLLEEKRIEGYLTFDNDAINITVSQSGINETIIRSVVDEIKSNTEIYNTLISKNMDSSDYSILIKNINNEINNIKVKLNNKTNANISYTMIEYYNLIAMAALYGGLISMFIINGKLANTSSVGKRVSISPIKKLSMLLGSLLASFIVQLIGLLLLFLYTIFVIKVDYGNLCLVLLLSILGVFAGLSLGIAIATKLKTSEAAKTGVLISITMLWCFLAGMTGITMKYVIDKNIPLLNIINPANMITDGFYSLYYYTDLNRFYFNIISLIIFSIIMILISLNDLIRRQYDSI